MIAAVVGNVGVAHFFQLLQGCVGAAAAAAIEVNRGIFIRAEGLDALADLFEGDVDGALQMAFFELFRRADVNPDAFGCFGSRHFSGGLRCGCGGNGAEEGGGKQSGAQ